MVFRGQGKIISLTVAKNYQFLRQMNVFDVIRTCTVAAFRGNMKK
jgi:hypothetical protein